MSIEDDVRLALRRVQIDGRIKAKQDLAVICGAADEWVRHFELLASLPPDDEQATEIEDAIGVAVMAYLRARQDDGAPITPVEVGKAAMGPIRLRAGYFDAPPGATS